MKLLLRSATIIHPQSAFNGKVVDISVQNGVIENIAASLDLPDNTELVDCSGKYLSPGFFDLNCNFFDPGFESKEGFESGLLAAACGGFTGVALMPNTEPAIDSKSGVSYIINNTQNQITTIFPLGAISQNRQGKDIAELYDMHLAGAVAFSDGNHPVVDSGLMSRAMLYAKGFDGLVFSFPEDCSIAGKGKMNEGEISTYLGMKGIPALAEELMVSRDIFLAEYNDCRLHFSTISTRRSVELIREAKKKGLKITCDVAAHHLVLTDTLLTGFDTQYKVKPPLRTQSDVDALLEGITDGTINAVVSQHTPHEVEFKDVEFEIAAYGIIALQTVLPMLVCAGLSADVIVDNLAINPRQLLNLPIPQFKVGQIANMVLFDLQTEWHFDAETNKSKSSNSPFLNTIQKGKVFMVCNNTKYLIS